MRSSITVQVRNFASYKGRADVTHNSWFRCSNRLLEDPDFYDYTHAELLVWIYILSLASIKDSPVVTLNFERAERVCRLKRKDILSSIEKLKENQVDPVDDTQTLRERNVDVSITCATDRQDRQTKKNSESEDSLPPVASVWNQVVKSKSKVKVWNKSREKNAKAVLEVINEAQWSEACFKVEGSEFLSGRSEKWKRCNFDWLLNTANVAKVLEGNYDESQAAKVVL